MSDLSFVFNKLRGFADIEIVDGDFLLAGKKSVAVYGLMATSGYAIWTHPTLGRIITTVADVGADSPVDYFVYQDYPDTITVSGAGSVSLNKEYTYAGSVSSSPLYADGLDKISLIEIDGSPKWAIYSLATFPSLSYDYPLSPYLPPFDEWETSSGGIDPAPTLAYTVPTNQYVGQGAFSGTITINSESPLTTSSSDAVPAALQGNIAWNQSTKVVNGVNVQCSNVLAVGSEDRADTNLETAIGLSLFTDRRATDAEIKEFQSGITDRQSRRGYWANTYRDIQQGSGLWLLSRSKKQELTRSRAESYALESLQWLKNEGIAASVDVSATFTGRTALDIAVSITKPSGEDLNYKYQFAWS